MNQLNIKNEKIAYGDNFTDFKAEMMTEDNDIIEGVQYLRLTRDFINYIEIENFTVNDNVIHFKIPDLMRGTYHVEVMDNSGRFFPSDLSAFITVNVSTEKGKRPVYVNHKNEVINTVIGHVSQYIDDNPEEFTGKSYIPILELESDGTLYYKLEEI